MRIFHPILVLDLLLCLMVNTFSLRGRRPVRELGSKLGLRLSPSARVSEKPLFLPAISE